MPSFRLFRKPKKQEEPEKEAMPPQEPEKTDIPSAGIPSGETQQAETKPAEPEPQPEAPAPTAPAPNKTYLKALPLRELTDLEAIKEDVTAGNILILRITPLASKSIDDVKNAVNELYAFTESIGGDIARLGEERVVICPKNIKIWREKTPEKTPVSNEALPTAA
jgi:uncharacterized protein